MLRKMVLGVLRFYQKTCSSPTGLWGLVSPGFHCRFHPSCSEYAIAAIAELGPFQGGLYAIIRLCRCHPFSRGGYHPPPRRKGRE